MTNDEDKEIVQFTCSHCGPDNCTAKALRKLKPKMCSVNPEISMESWMEKIPSEGFLDRLLEKVKSMEIEGDKNSKSPSPFDPKETPEYQSFMAGERDAYRFVREMIEAKEIRDENGVVKP